MRKSLVHPHDRFGRIVPMRLMNAMIGVDSNLASNSGSGSDSLVNPKFSAAIGPWNDTEFFVAAGQGYDGNDLRGATISDDPSDGIEAGIRTAIIPRTQLSVALWQLEIDSELLFVGDSGATEASRPSRRRGIEIGIYARPVEWMIVDGDFAWSEPRFRDENLAGDYIPGAVERVASLGLTFESGSGWFGGARIRYLGPSALIEDNSVRAPDTLLVNLEAGRRLTDRLKLRLGLYNALDSDASDIRYYYDSRLPGEAAPVDGRSASLAPRPGAWMKLRQAPACPTMAGNRGLGYPGAKLECIRAGARGAVRSHRVPEAVIRERSTEK